MLRTLSSVATEKKLLPECVIFYLFLVGPLSSNPSPATLRLFNGVFFSCFQQALLAKNASGARSSKNRKLENGKDGGQEGSDSAEKKKMKKSKKVRNISAMVSKPVEGKHEKKVRYIEKAPRWEGTSCICANRREKKLLRCCKISRAVSQLKTQGHPILILSPTAFTVQ